MTSVASAFGGNISEATKDRDDLADPAGRRVGALMKAER
jgi:hypothetical protein